MKRGNVNICNNILCMYECTLIFDSSYTLLSNCKPLASLHENQIKVLQTEITSKLLFKSLAWQANGNSQSIFLHMTTTKANFVIHYVVNKLYTNYSS